MRILVPSRSRAQLLKTPYKIPPEFRHLITVYVAKEQLDEYMATDLPSIGVKIKAVSTMADKLGQKLYLMAKDCEDPLLMMCDDDFNFFRRTTPEGPKLLRMTADDWGDLISDIKAMFEKHSHLYGVGVSMRQGNLHLAPEPTFNTRINGCITYRRDLFLSAKHDRTNPMNDFDVNLQLLRAGWDNCVLSQYVYNQGNTNDPGGSSDYRTLESHAAAADYLEKTHAPFVQTRMKVNKTGTDFKERKEVRVYWKKARKSAKPLKQCNTCYAIQVHMLNGTPICNNCGNK